MTSSDEYNKTPRFSELAPLDDSDIKCMADLREVLEKHGKLDRFGVTLLHRHFNLEENEVLVESSNPESRTLTQRPESVTDNTADGLVDTSWYLGRRLPITLGKCRDLWHLEK